MAKWNQLVITEAGYQLSASAIGTNQIQFTHVQTTDTDMSKQTADQLKALTSLSSVKQDLKVGTVTVQDDHTVNIPVKVTNQDLTADYLLYGLALFAKPVNGDEILYGIATAVLPDLIPAANGSTVTGTNFNLKVHVGSASSVNIVVTPDASVSEEELSGVLKSYVKTVDLDSKGYATTKYVDDKISTIPKPDMSKYQTPTLTANDGSPKLVIASGDDVNDKLGSKIGTTDAGTVSIDIGAKNNSANHTVFGTYQSSASAVNATVQFNEGTTWSIAGTKDSSGNATVVWQQLANQKDLGTKADDANVVHNTGDEEIAGTKTFDTAPIDKTTKKPYITSDGVPSIPSDVARTGQDVNFTGKLQKSGQDVAIDSQVVHRNPDTGAVSDSVNFTGPAQKGGIDLATVQDLKSVEDSAWRQLDSSLITLGGVNSSFDTHCLYRIDSVNKRIYISWTIILGQPAYNHKASLDFSGIVSRFTNKGAGHMLSQVDEVSPDSFNFNISGSNISFAIPAYANIVLSGYQNDCWFEYDTLLI